MNAFLADECRCSPSLPLQQAKLEDAAWKAANHGKDEVVVSDVLSSSANDGECMTKSFVVPVPKFLSDTKFPSDRYADTEMHTFVFKAANSSILALEKVQFVFGWGRVGGGSHLLYMKDVTFRK